MVEDCPLPRFRIRDTPLPIPLDFALDFRLGLSRSDLTCASRLCLGLASTSLTMSPSASNFEFRPQHFCGLSHHFTRSRSTQLEIMDICNDDIHRRSKRKLSLYYRTRREQSASISFQFRIALDTHKKTFNHQPEHDMIRLSRDDFAHTPLQSKALLDIYFGSLDVNNSCTSHALLPSTPKRGNRRRPSLCDVIPCID